MFRSVCSSVLQRRSYAEVKWARIPMAYTHRTIDPVKVTSLPNGLRIVTRRTDYPTATVGFFIDSGSRAENKENNGVAHFFEHMAFKGSSKFSQNEMENMVENMGARLFAYTSREQTVYYGKCFTQDGPKVVEILSDIIQSPLLNEKAIDRERGVILREMEDIETQLDEVVFDYLHGTAYQDTSLAFTILGPSKNVNTINHADLVSYIKQNYTAGRIVMIAVGDVDHDEYVELGRKYLSGIAPTSDHDLVQWYPAAEYLGSGAYLRNDDMPFAHVAFGYEGVPATHENFIPLMVVSNFIGSWDQSCNNGKVMPSRLAGHVSRHDICRSYSSFYACYKDTALWGIYFATKGEQMQQFVHTLLNDWKELQVNFCEGWVEQAKNSLKTNWLMQMDGTTPQFEEIGRQMLTYGKTISNEEFEEAIDRCTSHDCERALNDMMSGRCPVIAAMGPIEGVPAYPTLRSTGKNLLS